MKKAMPEGGRAMLFVGTMDADNARERAQGIREALRGGNIEIVDIRTDESDFARARRNAEDALARERNLGMMVGLWAYNTPQIYQAVREAGRQGQVKIVGFDEDALTLRGVADGTIHSTVVQQPYEFGYQSMKGLVRVINGDRGWIPGNKQVIVETKVIDRANVGEFQSYMRGLLRGS
jgi:ribose transport system substrate-binding protein